MRSGVKLRHASGLREHDLYERAKALRASVDPLLPRVAAGADHERLDRLRDELEAVREARDDARRLERYRRWGDPIARAYAGLLSYYLDRQLPEMLAFSLPSGEVAYAPLSRAPREVEAAVQQSDDPRRLLLAYLDWAKRGYHFFATPKTLWTTGRSPTPPDEVLRAKLASLPYRFVEGSDPAARSCSHLAVGEPRPFLEVGWRGAGVAFRVCRKCVKDDRQLLAALTDGIIVPDPHEEFPVRVVWNVRCSAGDGCVHADLAPPSRSLIRSYELGRLADLGFVEAYDGEIKPRIDGARSATFVAQGVCYGADRERFLDALHPSPVERRALAKALEANDGYFEVDEPSASRALERLWSRHAEAIVGAIVPDPDEAARWIQEAKGSPGRIVELLKRAQRKGEERELLGSLPRYARLSPEAEYVDRVARSFRTHGETGAERTALQALPREGKGRGLAFALLLALGRSRSHDWQFSPTEREFGTSLERFAREVLGAPPERYHEALDRLFHSAGVAEWGERTAE